MTAALAQRVQSHKLWYHTIDLGGGVVTPGWFDLRPITDRLPWPDVAGKRCLDVGTYDGFLAFELERRGAAEVVATDIPDDQSWDFLPRDKANALAYFKEATEAKGAGFRLAAEQLESAVQRREVSIYDLSPDNVGMFDVVVVGALLLHLRDPFRALAAVRSICAGELLSIEQVDPRLTLVQRRRPSFYLGGQRGQWLIPNARGHEAMLHVAGFDILESVGRFSVPFGPAHPRMPLPWRRRLERRLLGGAGIVSHAVRARVVSDSA